MDETTDSRRLRRFGRAAQASQHCTRLVCTRYLEMLSFFTILSHFLLLRAGISGETATCCVCKTRFDFVCHRPGITSTNQRAIGVLHHVLPYHDTSKSCPGSGIFNQVEFNYAKENSLLSGMPMDLRTLRRPIHLVLDWDGTLTRKDTLALVGKIGYQHHGRSMRTEPSSLPQWSDLVNAYMVDFSAHQSSYSPKPEARRSIKEERDWLASLAPIENASVTRVQNSGLFNGVTANDVQLTASEAVESGELVLRHGWASLFDLVCGKHNEISGDANPSKISILSVNWSERFIRHALAENVQKCAVSDTPGEQAQLLSYIQHMEIRANDIANLDAPEGSDGSLTKKCTTGIRTSADKLANMPAHCRHRLDSSSRADGNPSSGDKPTVIYVGDSATDLESLLAADVGICVRDEPMGSSQRELADTLERVGVQVVRIGELSGTANYGEVVYWARDLQEIADMLSRAGG